MCIKGGIKMKSYEMLKFGGFAMLMLYGVSLMNCVMYNIHNAFTLCTLLYALPGVLMLLVSYVLFMRKKR